jgi:hypothetical protein
MENLKNEYNAGRFNTEPQMVAAMQQFKREAKRAMENAEARYNAEDVEAYANRGGVTSSAMSGGASPPQPAATTPGHGELPSTVLIRDKRGGPPRRVPRDRAEKFLSNPNFEMLP